MSSSPRSLPTCTSISSSGILPGLAKRCAKHKERLTDMLSALRGNSGMWPESGPLARAAYLRRLLDDPRLRRTPAMAHTSGRSRHQLAAQSMPCHAVDCGVPKLPRVGGLDLEDQRASFGSDYHSPVAGNQRCPRAPNDRY